MIKLDEITEYSTVVYSIDLWSAMLKVLMLKF